MSSIFTQIINGTIPAFKIAENDLFIAFLDIEPLRKGHILVVPKEEVDKAYEADDIYLKEWLLFAQPIARAMEKAIPCKRIGISFIGLEVPHAHMHLVPISTANDLNFAQSPQHVSMNELAEIQQLILSKIL